MAEWDEFSERLRDVETREVHDAGAGAPVHNAAEGTQYWDATNDDLYINDDGAAGWQLVGGGGGGVPHNLLDGVVHPDTVLQGVSRGSIVYGDPTPLWNELVHPGAANRILQSAALDVQWSANILVLTANLTNLGGAANQVAYWSGVNTLTSDAGLRVDAANDFYLVADAGGIGNSAATARLVFDSSGVDYANFADCVVFINETANANMDIGLTIDQDAYDNEILNLRSSDVGAVWNGVETSTYGTMRKADSPAGGLHIAGYKDADGVNYVAMQLSGYLAEAPNTTKSTAGHALIELRSYQTDGTNVVNTVANGNLVAFRTHRGGAAVTTAIWDEDGDMWLDGSLGINTTPDRRQHTRETSASTNVIVPVARFESEVSGGVGAVGHGAGVEFYGKSSTTTNQGMGELAFRWDTATHASRRSRFELYTWYIGNDVLSGVIVNAGYASADGNARGAGAVDWQNYRTAVTQVASGAQAVLCGGALNTAAGGNSAVCGGYSGNITAPALSAFIGAGLNDQVSGAYAATLAGRENTVSGTYAAALGGYYCLADKRGQIASATGRFAAQGDAQGTIQIVARRLVATHAVNTWYELYLDGISAGLHVIAASSAWTIHALVVGINFAAGSQWSYELTGLLERDNAGNTTLASYTLRTIFESDANYEARLAADNVNEALKVEVRRTGGADSNIRWVATIRTAEVSYS